LREEFGTYVTLGILVVEAALLKEGSKFDLEGGDLAGEDQAMLLLSELVELLR